MADDDRMVISRKAVMDAWYEAQDAIIAETEARKEFEHLHKICDEKKRKFSAICTQSVSDNLSIWYSDD